MLQPLSPSRIEDLIAQAQAVAKRAYAPYSRFAVGAAILAATDQIITGCNVENSSYGLTICAERSAAVSAISAGIRNWRAIAIVSPTGVTPCGACRQFLAEFNLDLQIILCRIDTPKSWESMLLSQLLPNAMKLDLDQIQLHT